MRKRERKKKLQNELGGEVKGERGEGSKVEDEEAYTECKCHNNQFDNTFIFKSGSLMQISSRRITVIYNYYYQGG